MRWRWCVPLAALLACGCQSYQPEPLKPADVLRDWRERSTTFVGVAELLRDKTGVASTTQPAFDPADGLTLVEAEAVALLFNPELRAARLEAGVAVIGAAQAGRWDDPVMSVDAERILSGVDEPWVLGGMLNVTIPLSGRPGLEKKLAHTEADVARLKLLQQERQTIAELRRAWAAWSSNSARSQAIEMAVGDLTAIDSSAQRLRDAGELDPTEARLYTIDLTRRRGELARARADVARTEAAMLAILGLVPEAGVRFVDTAWASTVQPSPAESHVELAVAGAEYAASERSLELEVRRQYPDLTVGSGLGVDEGEERLLGGLSVPIPLFNGNLRAIAEARARRDASRSRYESVMLTLAARRVRAEADVSAARDAIATLERDLVPLVDRQLADARTLLDAGEFNPLLVREAIDAATDTKLDLIDARRALGEAIAEQLYLVEPLGSNAASFREPRR